MRPASGMSPDQFAQAVVEGGQVPMLVGEVARGKALAVVVEAAKVTDTNGEVVDLEDDEDEDGETVVASADADQPRRGRGRDRRGPGAGHHRGLSPAGPPAGGPRNRTMRGGPGHA